MAATFHVVTDIPLGDDQNAKLAIVNDLTVEIARDATTRTTTTLVPIVKEEDLEVGTEDEFTPPKNSPKLSSLPVG